MVLDYFAYWNGAQLRDLFEAVVAITSGPSYQGLIKSAVLAGFLVTLTTALFRWQGMAAKTFLFAVVLFYSLLLIPKTDLSIHDERAGTVHVVQNVPFGIGFFASVTSRIGHFLTTSFESAFALPDAEKFSKFGMVYPQRAVSVLQGIGTATPLGRRKVNRFVADCLTPELTDNPAKVNELAQSSDLWATVTASGWLNPARSTLNENGEVKRCDEAAVELETFLNSSELDEIKKKLGALLTPDRADPAQAIMTSLPHAESLLLGLSRSLDSSLKHSIMLQAIPEGVSSIAQLSGSPLSLAVNLTKAQGNLASEISYRTMSEIAKVSLPKIRNCIEFVIIAAFPLVFILIIAAGSNAGFIFRSFFVLLIWVQLWAPLYAVANYLLISVDSNPMNRIIAEYGGNSLMAVDLIRQTGASSQAMAGYLMLAIPMLALAIAKGSDYAAAALVGGLMGPAQSASQGLSGQLSSGNFSSGNLSTGNVSSNSINANKNDTSSSFADPYTSKISTAYGTVTRDGDNHVTGMVRSGIDLGISSSSTLQQSRSVTTSSMSSTSLTTSEMTNLSLSKSATSSDSGSVSFAKALSYQLDQSHSSSQNLSDQSSYNSSNSYAQSSTASSGLTTNQNLSFSTGAGVKVGTASGEAEAPGGQQLPLNPNASLLNAAASGPSAAKQNSILNTIQSAGSAVGEIAGLEAGLRTTTAQNIIDTATGAKSSATAEQRSQAYSQVRSAAQQIAASTSESRIKNAAENFVASLDKAHHIALQRSKQFNTAEGASEARSAAETGSDSTSVNNDVLVMNRLLHNGKSAESSLEEIFHQTEVREQVGFDRAAQAKVAATGKETFGAGQIDAPRQFDKAIGKTMIQQNFQENEQEVLAQNQQFRNQIQEESRKQHTEPERNKAFVDSVRNQAQTIDNTKTNLEDNAKKQEQGVTTAVDRYRLDQKGLSAVLAVSLAGGLGYRGPME
ncbi:conjugal transfer protein TraG N-terminal domain-containing protein [Turicimonas muris]|uniref:conjugal transfer protein TraG N-terminal domain-containing protein n=1 Tax=Turicimonas muris TaxID=1796652 RepID=UPI00248D3A23|nr:conjugal transfer protein TraG N-terminal domain-containing protein [Turicimonas muris]